MARLSRRELKRQIDWRARDILKFIEVQEKAARKDPNKMPPNRWRDYGDYQNARREERHAEQQRYYAAIHEALRCEDPKAQRMAEHQIMEAGFKAMALRPRAGLMLHLGARERLQVINAGYKATAMKSHPDVGGSHDDMVRLNAAAKRLRRRWQR
jgi:hypothetical protein